MSTQVSSPSLQATTRLDSLVLPGRAQILQEAFGVVPPELFPQAPQPQTVGELATHAKLTVDDTVQRLLVIMDLANGVEIDADELSAAIKGETPPILLDVREPWEYEQSHLSGSLLLATLDFAALLPRLQAAPSVVTLCAHGIRSLSAALFLRQRGVAARSLSGGLSQFGARHQ